MCDRGVERDVTRVRSVSRVGGTDLPRPCFVLEWRATARHRTMETAMYDSDMASAARVKHELVTTFGSRHSRRSARKRLEMSGERGLKRHGHSLFAWWNSFVMRRSLQAADVTRRRGADDAL